MSLISAKKIAKLKAPPKKGAAKIKDAKFSNLYKILREGKCMSRFFSSLSNSFAVLVLVTIPQLNLQTCHGHLAPYCYL